MSYTDFLAFTSDFEKHFQSLLHVELHVVMDEATSTDNLALIEWLFEKKDIQVTIGDLRKVCQNLITAFHEIRPVDKLVKLARYIYDRLTILNILQILEDEYLEILVDGNVITDDGKGLVVFALLDRKNIDKKVEPAVRAAEKLWKKIDHKNSFMGRKIQREWRRHGRSDLCTKETSHQPKTTVVQLIEFLTAKGYIDELEELENMHELFLEDRKRENVEKELAGKESLIKNTDPQNNKEKSSTILVMID